MDKRYKTLAHNSSFVFIGNVGSKLITFLMLPYYTSRLTTSEYGESDIINTYASILLAVISCSIADAIFAYAKNAANDSKKSYFTSGLLFSFVSFFIVGIVSLFLWRQSDSWSLQGSFYKDLLWIWGLSFGMFIQSYMQQFALCIGKMFQYSMTGIIMTVLTALLAFVFLPIYGLSGYLLSLILAQVGASIYTFIFAGLYQYISLKSVRLVSLRELLTYGFPLIPNSIMWWLVSGINRPIIENQIGLAAVGIFAVANKFPSVLSMLCTVLASAWNISVIDEIGKEDFNVFFNRTLKFIFICLVICGCTISFFSKLIVTVFASNDFYEAWMYIPLLTMGVTFQSMASFVGSIFMAEKESKYFFFSSIWSAVVSVVATFFFINLWGIIGACIATVSSFVVMLIARIAYSWNKINQFDISYYCKMSFLYIVFIVCVMFDKGTLFTMVVFLIILSLIFYLNKNDINVIINKIKR